MSMAYEIKLDIFEGPLDLLLYLIKKDEIDIYNIPIASITDQYLQYLEILRSLNLDLAGEYLILASTLIHIKSRMLLPKAEVDDSEAEEDPRDELVQQLLEYKAYKDAALCLDSRFLLERDVFKRAYALTEECEADDSSQDDLELNLFDLVKAFQNIVAKMDKVEYLDIKSETMSLADMINEIMEKLAESRNMTFQELLEGYAERTRIIYAFLAILELVKMKVIRVYQNNPFGVIRIIMAVEESV